MTDSLTISNQIELLGNGTYSTIPACAGAQFRLAPGYDLSAPQPTSDIVASLVLDGERPFGRRASNRQISLPLAITAPNRALLAAARETLLQAIDAQTWTLTWTRSGGLPLVLDCFRALPSVVTYELSYDRQLWSLITVSFPALPYGRSNLPVQLAVASPISGGSAVAAPPAPVVLDAFTSVSGTQWSQSAQHVIGPNSAYWDPGASPASNPTGAGIFPVKSGTFAAKNLTGLTAVSVWAGCGSSYIWNWELAGQPSTFAWTLTDSVGHTLTFGRTYTLQSSNAKLSPKWQLVTASIPAVASSGVFNMAAVTGYSVSVSNHADWTGQQFTYANFYLDTITAQPPSTTSAASARGAIYQLYGILGTSHAPLTLQFQQKISAPPVTVVLSGSGTFLPPAGVSVASVLALGGGGAGATQTTAGLGGGGGGGECALEAAYALTPGSPVAYSCGMGGLPLDVTPNVVLFGAAGTVTWTCPPGVTSLTAACVGGCGGGAFGGSGGGGGEYASQTVTVVPGTVYQVTVGAGGAGGAYFYNNGHLIPTGGTVYNSPAGAGGISTFGPAGSPVVTANGGGAAPNFSGTTALGGTGSSNTTHHDGGAGAVGVNNSYPAEFEVSPAGGGGTGGSGSAGNPGTSTTMGAVVTGGYGWGGYTGYSVYVLFDFPGASPPGQYEYIDGGTGAAGLVALSWVAASSVVNGTATTFGTSGTVVTAHGGTSASTNSATAGVAGTGSANTIHHDGGAGAAGASGTGGGGGASGGSAATGGAGTGAAGGIPGAGGTAGGNGAPSGDLAGSAGSPGAGGGGADMASIPVDGGPGGAGQITLTYTPTLAPFKTLIAHRPGPDAPATLTPFVSTTSPADPPDGRQYPVPSLVAGVNARFGGTYSVVLVAYNWDSPTVPRLLTVTVWQYEYPGGPAYPVSVSATITPSEIVNGIVTIGELTLPVRDIAPDNTTAYFTVGINSADLADQFLDVIFLDTLGSTLMVANNTEEFNNLYADAATVDRDIGRVMGSWYDRAEAVSILGSAFVSGGPLTVEGGQDAILLAYSLEGCPAVSITYTPRFFLDRTM